MNEFEWYYKIGVMDGLFLGTVVIAGILALLIFCS